MSHPGGNYDNRSDNRPVLCIPYWTAPIQPGGHWDDGKVRPLPNGVVSYMCEGIHASPYKPGEDLEVTVDIRNSGGGNHQAIVTVHVYLTEPSLVFADVSTLNKLDPRMRSHEAVPVLPDTTSPSFVTTPKITLNPPASAPEHACLLARVCHPENPGGNKSDPIGDPNWAQRNLFAIQAAVGTPVFMSFAAGNPFREGKTFEVALRPIDERHAPLVAREFRTEPASVPMRLRLLGEDGSPVSEQGRQVRAPVQLGPGERRRFRMVIELEGDLPRGRSAAVEALQLDTGRDRRIVGSLGVALLPR